MKRRFALGLILALLSATVLVPPAAAQMSASSAVNSALPRLVRFGGALKDLNGNPLTGVVGVTFALYSEQNGGSALWLETQNVNADSNGRYTVLLGATKPDGLPAELFTSEQARWVGVQISGQPEQARVLLVSAPYALKAGDAETIGGLPPSAFVLATSAIASGATANTASAAPTSAPPPGSSTVTTSGGTINAIPLFSTSTDIENSVISQTGSGTTAKIGIGTTTPASTLDVKGGATIRGTASVMGALSLPSTGAATTTVGKNSEPENFVASAYNSSSSAAANQTFQWQAEPAGNDTSTPSGTLNLLFGEGTTKPAETGLHIASNGQITFAAGQTFPGSGSGTVTSVASGAGLTGGPITGSGTLSIAIGGVTNAMLASPSLTITAGTDLTGGGSVALGGSTTIGLNLSATDARYAQLGANDTFTGTLNISTSSTSVSATSSGANAIYGDNTSSTGTGVTGIGSTGVSGQSVTGNGVLGTVTGSSGTGVYGNATGTSGGANGVQGSSSTPTGSGVVGLASGTGDGLYAANTDTSGSGNGVYGTTRSAAGTGVVGINTATSPTGFGVYGEVTGSASGATGVVGYANTTPPGTVATYGVLGVSTSQFPGSAGIYGYNAQDAISDPRIYGVYGALKTPDGGAGVGGTGATISGTGSSYAPFGAGVWGDADPNGYFGVFGTADDNVAVGAFNSSGTDTSKAALTAQNNSSSTGALVFLAAGGATNKACTIDVDANLSCSGTVTSIAHTDSGRQVSLFGMSSTENWFEDFGSGQLSGGSAMISLDPTFASTVNTSESYHVFLTPNGDCKGLYVASKTGGGFEVRELGGGTSSISFDYRIVAKRRGYENTRMQDVTDQIQRRRQAQEKMQSGQSTRKMIMPPQPKAPNLAERTPQGPRPIAQSVLKPISAPRP